MLFNIIPQKTPRTIKGETVYANNYKCSNLRAWLNGLDGSDYSLTNYDGKGFLNKAFALNNSYLLAKTVDNSAASTSSATNKYASDNTTDKVFLPSYQDLINTSYGFSGETTADSNRGARPTDYALAKGAFISLYGYYYTRSPSEDNEANVWGVDSSGALSPYSNVDSNIISVRPAIDIKIA